MSRGNLSHVPLKFLKAHGAGNDFIVLDEINGHLAEDLGPLARRLACRRTGIGADGLLVIRRNEGIPAMECWNADGSRAEACGNGLRVVSRILFEKEGAHQILTDSGMVPVEIYLSDSGEFLSRAVLGPVVCSAPLDFEIQGQHFSGIPVNVGNPHLVVSQEALTGFDPVRELGPTLEASAPERVNVGFYVIEEKNKLQLRVWERGCGETLACGTGAVAAVVALQQKNLLEDEVTVSMPGGELFIRKVNSSGATHMAITGPAEITFTGEVDLSAKGLLPTVKKLDSLQT